LGELKGYVSSGANAEAALKLLGAMKSILISFDSLPPIDDMSSPNAETERLLARETFENAVYLSIQMKDKGAFERNIGALRPYYSGDKIVSDNQCVVLGLNLLYLLVENKLAEFHLELELLGEELRSHPNINFCTQLDQHLMVGSYDQVLSAASNPPVASYSFFLTSLLETVRTNIAECAAASYSTLTATAAAKILMFTSESEALVFIKEQYPDWAIEGNLIDLRSTKSAKSEEISSHKLIQQTLGYATELERIV